MKTILLATDFSKAANKAIYIATQIAIKQQARLILFHSYRFLNTYDDNYGYPIDEVKKISTKKLNYLKRRILEKSEQPLEIILCNRHGFVMDTIKEAIAEYNVDLIIMSSVGDAPLGAGYFGSIATEMLGKLKVPMLILPPGYKLTYIENAVMAIDLKKPIDAIVFEKSIYFLRDLGAIVDVLYVAKNEAEANSEETKDAVLGLRELLKNVPHTFQTIIGTRQVDEMNAFVKKRKAQLLITFPQHHTFFERVFLQGNTRRLVFDAEVPVLAIH
ncbi:universal stress protein [Emticicia sp. BO119]|uniref:universal stress protein n=1 Tax=Emticicia sp. BO119 TaxID=2757768 RepID=UPI0015F07E44|nr:universal stress protein [Emticicia sp. BO119]MBA4848887.1 universal stress protein [Emticicia sp. BO119]